MICVLSFLWSCGSEPSSVAEVSAAEDAGATEEVAKDEDPEIAVEVSRVERQAIASIYATSATLRADKRATVIARTAGVVERLRVEEGDRVRKGQALAVLERDEQEIAWEAAVTTRDTRARESERAEKLSSQGLLSEEEAETKRRAAEEARQDAALAKLRLDRTIIRAPFDGRILVRHLDVGATVANGTAVYDLADLDPLYADVAVPERHVARLAAGQSVRLSADALEMIVEGRIERIGHEVDAATATVKVVVAVPPHEGLRPGAFVRVEIVTDSHPKAIVVPRSTLVAEGRHWYLFRVRDDGEHVDRLEVALGYEERELVELLGLIPASGDAGKRELPPLEAGDRVVSNGAPALSDGARIRLGTHLTQGAGIHPGAGGE